MAGLADAIYWIQDQMLAGTTGLPQGIRSAPDYPPETLNVFPAVLTYEGPGVWKADSAASFTTLYSIVIDLHVARKDMARDLTTLRGLLTTIPMVIVNNPTLGGNVQTYSQIDFSGLIALLPSTENQVGTIGYRWTIQGVKIRP